MLSGGETKIRWQNVQESLVTDGFKQGTASFRAELARRYTKVGTRTYIENDQWDGTKLSVDDYNEDGTRKT